MSLVFSGSAPLALSVYGTMDTYECNDPFWGILRSREPNYYAHVAFSHLSYWDNFQVVYPRTHTPSLNWDFPYAPGVSPIPEYDYTGATGVAFYTPDNLNHGSVSGVVVDIWSNAYVVTLSNLFSNPISVTGSLLGYAHNCYEHLVQMSQSGSVVTFTVNHTLKYYITASDDTVRPCVLTGVGSQTDVREIVIGDLWYDRLVTTGADGYMPYRTKDGAVIYTMLGGQEISLSGVISTTGDTELPTSGSLPINAVRSLYRTNYSYKNAVRFNTALDPWLLQQDITSGSLIASLPPGIIAPGAFDYAFATSQGSDVVSTGSALLYLSNDGYMFSIDIEDFCSGNPRYNKNWTAYDLNPYTPDYSAVGGTHVLYRTPVANVSAYTSMTDTFLCESGGSVYGAYKNALFSFSPVGIPTYLTDYGDPAGTGPIIAAMGNGYYATRHNVADSNAQYIYDLATQMQLTQWYEIAPTNILKYSGSLFIGIGNINQRNAGDPIEYRGNAILQYGLSGGNIHNYMDHTYDYAPMGIGLIDGLVTIWGGYDMKSYTDSDPLNFPNFSQGYVGMRGGISQLSGSTWDDYTYEEVLRFHRLKSFSGSGFMPTGNYVSLIFTGNGISGGSIITASPGYVPGMIAKLDISGSTLTPLIRLDTGTTYRNLFNRVRHGSGSWIAFPHYNLPLDFVEVNGTGGSALAISAASGNGVFVFPAPTYSTMIYSTGCFPTGTITSFEFN